MMFKAKDCYCTKVKLSKKIEYHWPNEMYILLENIFVFVKVRNWIKQELNSVCPHIFCVYLKSLYRVSHSGGEELKKFPIIIY